MVWGKHHCSCWAETHKLPSPPWTSGHLTLTLRCLPSAASRTDGSISRNGSCFRSLLLHVTIQSGVETSDRQSPGHVPIPELRGRLERGYITLSAPIAGAYLHHKVGNSSNAESQFSTISPALFFAGQPRRVQNVHYTSHIIILRILDDCSVLEGQNLNSFLGIQNLTLIFLSNLNAYLSLYHLAACLTQELSLPLSSPLFAWLWGSAMLEMSSLFYLHQGSSYSFVKAHFREACPNLWVISTRPSPHSALL